MNAKSFKIFQQQPKRFIFQTLPVSRRLYDILEIPIDADKKLVKSQFYKLSKRYHPDLNLGDDTAHKKFLLINEAYSILINDESRREYDRSIHNQKSKSRSNLNHSHFSSSNRPKIRRHTYHNFNEFNSSNFRRGTSHTDKTSSNSASSKDSKNKFNFQEHYQRHYSEELRRANSESNKERNEFLEKQLKSIHSRTVLRVVLIVSTLLLFGNGGGIIT